ncbi:hypothetical protein [Parapedobacter indicus]|uniref:Ig-like domain-containing protein n=1 Tax=Parapedobacter indicus TaxID=1477437 RepID=A0A1I3IYG9_9SPHI|nr:hypothetical protein [Parapedobacter indicus]PPL02332.1 hypothetical protein CLV26_104257 [Parapedobacter indicus]SFI52888.1 hypothetical protein SAMN05444682_104256 [Parapedobacter indicus]
MKQLSIIWLILPLVFGCHPVVAQLSLHIDEHFFAGKEIRKVETTNDGWVWVLGEGNFLARISPNNVVEDFTAQFATYSTKSFTDISSHMADTLLLGTKGDYAYLFANGDIRQIGPNQGLSESIITSVVIKKQYYHQYNYISDYNDVGKISLVTNLYVYRSMDFEYFNKHPSESFLYNKKVSFHQNDRKGFALSIFYGDGVGGGACYGADVSNIDLVAGHQGGSLLWNTPIDVFAHTPDSIRAVYTSSRVKDMFDYNFVKYWAGRTGLNYLANAPNCHQPSEPIHFFDDKEVSSIGELHLLGAATEDYLTYILVGTSTGLFVSNESQKQYFSTAYSRATVLGEVAINDMESMSDGVPVEINGWSVYYPFSFCEQRMYVATADGLFKLDYSIAPASYEQLGNTLYYNDNYLDSDTLITCGGDDHLLRLPFSIGVNNSIQWQRNGQDIIGADSNAVYFSESGTYRAVMWFGCENIEIYSKEVTVEMTDAPKFTFDYPDTVHICEGDTFPMEVKNAQSNYSYQWFQNGEALTGETSPAFSATEAGTYAVGVSACGDNFVFSDSVTVRLHHLEKPISSDRDILMCEGEPGTITVTGYAPETIKRWYRDGVLLPRESDPILVVSQPGAYTVEIAIGSCSVMSDELTVRFVALPMRKSRRPTTSHYAMEHQQPSRLIMRPTKPTPTSGQQGRPPEASW